MKRHHYLILPLALLLSACQSDKETTTQTDTNSADLLEAFYTEEAPADPAQISEVFSDPTPGREIVLAGEVMGRTQPFIDGRAMVVLGDPTKITPCNRIPGDECPTPWDVCCDDPDVIKTSVATIQLLGEDGRPLKAGLQGYRGITELSYLTVKGTIAEGSNDKNLLVNASAFSVTDPSPYKDAPPVVEGGRIEMDGDTFIFIKE